MFVVISFPTSFYRILIVNETISKLNFPFDHEKSVCAHKTSNLINPFYFLVKSKRQQPEQNPVINNLSDFMLQSSIRRKGKK